MSEDNGTSKYVVQRQDTLEGVETWTDIATVAVPPRTKRKTILEKALAEAGERQEGLYRVLDEESQREMRVSLEEQPPRLKIG